MNVKRILSIALAVVLCLGLAVPAMAAFPETWDEAKEKMAMESTLSVDEYNNWVEQDYTMYCEEHDWTNDTDSLVEQSKQTGYNVVPSDGSIAVKAVGEGNDYFLRIILRIFEKESSGKYVARYDVNYGNGFDWRKGDFFEYRAVSGHEDMTYETQYQYVDPGKTEIIQVSALAHILERVVDQPKSIENYLFQIELQQEYPEEGRYWYTYYNYVVDDAKAAEFKAAGKVEDDPGNPFDDVPKDAYYHDAVVWALENNVTTGMTETTFGPKETCTRGQVATFLWRAKGCPEPETTENPFTDVTESDYYYKPILWAYENGITTGTTETTFSPNGTCTSAHVITFLWRANGEPEAKTDGTEYYAEAVAWATKNKLLEGTDMAFAPDNLSPRGDIVTYLYRDAK